MITDKNFSERNGFIWFTGVVEDSKASVPVRVRVRCILHTDDKIELPTTDLPWSQCVMLLQEIHLWSRSFSVFSSRRHMGVWLL